jgi:hypothetical protein
LFRLSSGVVERRWDIRVGGGFVWYVMWLSRVVMSCTGPRYVLPSSRCRGRWLVPVDSFLPSQSWCNIRVVVGMKVLTSKWCCRAELWYGIVGRTQILSARLKKFSKCRIIIDGSENDRLDI